MARQFNCSECSFQVRSENEDEVIEMAQNHADQAHAMSPAADEIRVQLRDVDV